MALSNVTSDQWVSLLFFFTLIFCFFQSQSVQNLVVPRCLVASRRRPYHINFFIIVIIYLCVILLFFDLISSRTQTQIPTTTSFYDNIQNNYLSNVLWSWISNTFTGNDDEEIKKNRLILLKKKNFNIQKYFIFILKL